MTQTEKNILIAEFDGWTLFTWDDEFWGKKGDRTRKSPINYSDDWSELMPVVEKIEKLNDKIRVTDVVIGSTGCIIYARNGFDAKDTFLPAYYSIDYPHGTKIQAVYEAVVQFIIWLNDQKKES